MSQIAQAFISRELNFEFNEDEIYLSLGIFIIEE